MKVYMIRHGQSEANLKKMHSGWGSFSLTEKGREDAARAGRILKGITFDKVYSSDLPRAVETQMIALSNSECEQNALLREINSGNLKGRLFAECLQEFGEGYSEHRRLFEFQDYGGECYQEFCSRVRKFMSIMEGSTYEKVAVFCHGGFINTMLDIVAGKRLERKLFPCENGSVTVFEFKDGIWKVRLWNYNDNL